MYAAPLVTLFADKTTPGGLATCGYDDDGVRTQRWNLVEKGKFVGYQTTREQAGWIGEKASRGCSYAQDHAAVPFQRMPNVSLAPGEKDLSAEDLIKATDDGVYVVGTGSWSIDHQRYNFQFTGQMFFEVKKGKITRSAQGRGLPVEHARVLEELRPAGRRRRACAWARPSTTARASRCSRTRSATPARRRASAGVSIINTRKGTS